MDLKALADLLSVVILKVMNWNRKRRLGTPPQCAIFIILLHSPVQQ